MSRPGQSSDSSTSARRLMALTAGRMSALQDVCLEITRGDFYCLLGPSGCGKSTILNLIAGLEKPDDGEVEIVGPGAA